MRKQYIAPTIAVYKMPEPSILAGSDPYVLKPQEGGGEGQAIDPGEGSFGGGEALARPHGSWSDEE